MAQQIYKKEIKKACPRCESKEMKVAVFHFGATHHPMCANCGLTVHNNTADHQDIAEEILTNAYYEWEEKHPKP